MTADRAECGAEHEPDPRTSAGPVVSSRLNSSWSGLSIGPDCGVPLIENPYTGCVAEHLPPYWARSLGSCPQGQSRSTRDLSTAEVAGCGQNSVAYGRSARPSPILVARSSASRGNEEAEHGAGACRCLRSQAAADPGRINSSEAPCFPRKGGVWSSALLSRQSEHLPEPLRHLLARRNQGG